MLLHDPQFDGRQVFIEFRYNHKTVLILLGDRGTLFQFLPFVFYQHLYRQQCYFFCLDAEVHQPISESRALD